MKKTFHAAKKFLYEEREALKTWEKNDDFKKLEEMD